LGTNCAPAPFSPVVRGAGRAQIACMRPASSGFTLVELLATLLVAATLLTLATPGFAVLRDEWALRAGTNAVLGGLAEARLGALSQQSEGRLCPSQDGYACSARGTGFLVRAGRTGAERTLRVSRMPSGVEISGNRPAATYYAWPRAASPVTLTLCAVRQRSRARLVIVSQTGRPRVEPSNRC